MNIQQDLSKKKSKRKSESQFMLDRRDGSVAVVITHQECPESSSKNAREHGKG